VSLIDEDVELPEVEHVQDEKMINRSPTLYFFSSTRITKRLNHRTLHGEETVDNKKDVLPWPVRPGLALRDDPAEELLERPHVVMLEHADVNTRELHADMVEG
jgi:hypothetical protein